MPAPWVFTILRFCCTQQFEILATGLLLSSHHIFKVLGLRFYNLQLLVGFFFYVHYLTSCLFQELFIAYINMFLISRKYCIFCKCPVECHDIPQNSSYQNLPEDRMCVEEKPPRSSLAKVKGAHSEGYEWVPAGLSSGQVYAVVY